MEAREYEYPIPEHGDWPDDPETLAFVELRLQSLMQLFNNLDPAPFHEKELDADAEEYIFASFEDIPSYPLWFGGIA